MKVTLLALLSILLVNFSFAQDSSTGNLIRLSSEKIEDYDFNIYYSPLSEDAVSEENTSDIERFMLQSAGVPSLIFELKKDENSLFGIMPAKKMQKEELTSYYEVKNFSGNNRVEMECKVPGYINKFRAEELVKKGIDPEASIVKENDHEYLAFAGKKYEIQDYESLKTEARSIARQLINFQANAGNYTMKYIREESIGGKLDFVRMLKEEGKDSTLMYKNAELTPNQFAILLWGGAVHKLGVESFEKAASLWEDIHNKQMDMVEETMLREGFYSTK